MGRIKGTLIKNVGKELLAKSDAFTGSFNENKQKLNELGFKGTKAERNKIAGFISKKIKKRNQMQEAEAAENAPSEQAPSSQ